MMVKIDVAPSRDEDVLTLSARLSELAGQACGHIALDLSVVEEFSTAWMKTLADLSRTCRELGGELEMAGMCPIAEKVLNDTRRLQSGPVRRRRRREDERDRAVAGGWNGRDRRGRPAAVSPPARLKVPS